MYLLTIGIIFVVIGYIWGLFKMLNCLTNNMDGEVTNEVAKKSVFWPYYLCSIICRMMAVVFIFMIEFLAKSINYEFEETKLCQWAEKEKEIIDNEIWF